MDSKNTCVTYLKNINTSKIKNYSYSNCIIVYVRLPSIFFTFVLKISILPNTRSRIRSPPTRVLCTMFYFSRMSSTTTLTKTKETTPL